MKKCPYCGLEARTDCPVEFRCGSVTNWNRSKVCLVLEIGQLKDRVKRLEEAGDTLATVTLRNGRSHDQWHAAKETKP
jgi:hypothetical protein